MIGKQLSLFLFFVGNILFSQTFTVETIKNAGANDKHINLVILGDGYTASEQTSFRMDAQNFSDAMFSQSPFAEYTNYFNVHIIQVISNESGASHPQTTTDAGCADVPVHVVDNFFGSAYDSFGSHRLLYTPNSSLISQVLATNFPEYDQALILVNAPYYGGSGGTFPKASTGVSANEIAIHEIGHSLVNLKDEYYPGDYFAEEGINMTQQADPTLVKWTNWVNTSGVGVYPYCTSGSCATWYRPHQRCKMRYLGDPFCAVCKEGIIEKIHDLIVPISNISPENLTVEVAAFPIDFNLSLIEPIPNSLETTWTLNGNVFANNTAAVSLTETHLPQDTNTLTAVVVDTNNMQRINNHETIHANMVSWTISTSTLGIAEIIGETHSIDISVYPNPTADNIYIYYKSNRLPALRAELTTMQGKQLNTTTLQPGATNSITLHNQAAGFYLVHIYNKNTLITTRKLIKQ
ncbi:M64 family metallopeptidase [Bizionia sediminis]|uniref:M64 family metallopeptidase n=1 Tax=Bizionia sediminis TaxID=1737064 RepID=A0ABW5KW57_9FLAO